MKELIGASFLFVLLMVAGCMTANVGGSTETVEVIFVEPGEAGIIAQDDPIKVTVSTGKDGKGPKRLAKRNLAGMRVLPESVYQKLRAEYIKNHPEAATSESSEGAKK